MMVANFGKVKFAARHTPLQRCQCFIVELLGRLEDISLVPPGPRDRFAAILEPSKWAHVDPLDYGDPDDKSFGGQSGFGQLVGTVVKENAKGETERAAKTPREGTGGGDGDVGA